jgi:hypothetical protein
VGEDFQRTGKARAGATECLGAVTARFRTLTRGQWHIEESIMGTQETDRGGKAKDDEEKDKNNNDRDGKDNDKQGDRPRSGRVVIKSCPSKPTRLTLRGTRSKPVAISRPPWNTGSPSPASTKAQAMRSIRLLPTKLPDRPRVQRQPEEPKSSPTLKDAHQPGPLRAEPGPLTPPPEPTSLIIPHKDPKAGLKLGYKQLEEFLQHATGTATSPRTKEASAKSHIIQSSSTQKDQCIGQLSTVVKSKEARRQANARAATVATQTETLKRAIKLHQPSRDQTQDESFSDSDLMTSPRLKMPLSSPALTLNQPSSLQTTQSPLNSNSRTNEQVAVEENLASARRRAYILAVIAQDEELKRSLVWAQARSDPLFELDQESDEIHAAPQRRRQSAPTAVKIQVLGSGGRPISTLQPDPETSDDEQSTPQAVAPPLPNVTRVTYPEPRTLPVSRFQVGPDTPNDEQDALQRVAQATPPMVKTQSTIARHWPISAVQFDSETSSDKQAPYQSAARPIPNIMKVPCPGARTGPISQFQLDPELAEELEPGQQRATLPLPQVQIHQHCSTEEQTTTQRPVEPNHMAPRVEYPAPSIFKPTCAQIPGSESPFHADAESTEEDCASKSRSIINCSRRLRQSRSQSSVKSVKWDPAIIACGPITATRKLAPKPKANESLEASKAASEKDGMEENLEAFRKTISQWKKGDRKAIKQFLKALKALDSDEESISKSKPSLMKELKQSKILSNSAPGRGLNPLAPAFRDFSSQKATENNMREVSFFNVIRKRPHSVKNSHEMSFIAKDSVKTRKPIPRAIRPCPEHHVQELRKQEPIWINNFQQSPTSVPAEDQEDEDFQKFCRANNFIPIMPVNPNPIIPIAPPEPIIPILAPYLPFLPDPLSNTYTLPFEDTKLWQSAPLSQPVWEILGVPFTGPAPLTQRFNQQTVEQDFIFTLKETSEPIEDGGSREAKALDPAWGAQILDNFVKKFPMTGQRKRYVPVSEQNENRKSLAKGQHKLRLKVEGKAGGVKVDIKRATEIQQRLEMILLQQKERRVPLAPAHKIKATEIQQKLEIMLYKLKEQKAWEDFSKTVPKRTERNSQRLSEKHFEKDVSSSRSPSKSSKGTVEHIEKLR